MASSSQPVRGSRRPPLTTNSSNRLPPSTAPAHSRDSAPPPSRMANLEKAARAITAQSKDLKGRRPQTQTRTPWDELECDRLIEMVARHGTKWAHILNEDAIHEDGPRLQHRTQVNLKDKARNIKILYLKTRDILPPGFEVVSIGERYVKELSKLGIDYVESRYKDQDHDGLLED